MSQSLKRIQKDLKEIREKPLDGIAICIPDDSNLYELHANILIQDGSYKGILLHAYIHLPPDYPSRGPSMNIAKGIKFDQRFHEHVMNDPYHGNTICNDMLTNYASYFECIDNGQRKVATGWTPGCTLFTLLLQMTVFFSDSDLPIRCRPSEQLIDQFKHELSSFTCPCGHSTACPYPPIDAMSSSMCSLSLKQSSSSSEEPAVAVEVSPEEKRLSYLRERLSCGITRANIIDDAIILGYPVHVTRNNYGKLTFTAFIEPISYTCYLDARGRGSQVTAMGNQYTHWIPCYLNAAHLAGNPTLPEACLTAIKNGVALSTSANGAPFNPLVALEVLVLLMNQIMIAIFNGSSHNSQTLIEGFCHLLQLLIHFIRKYPTIKTQLEKEVKAFIGGATSKREVPDIGVFLMKAFLARSDYNSFKRPLLEEYFARQVFWMNKDHNVDHNEKNMDNRLSRAFQAAKISNSLYVFLYSLFTKVISAAVVAELDANYGLLSQTLIDDIKATIQKIKTDLTGYRVFSLATNTGDLLTTPIATMELLNKAVVKSNAQGYTKLKIVK